MNEFLYDDNAPYDVNFHRWYVANCIEREIYKEPKLDIDNAEVTFSKMWGFKKIESKVFVN